MKQKTKRGNGGESLEKTAMRVSAWSLFWNCLLFFLKLFAGFFARSGAMVSDAFHTASDLVSTVVVIIGVKLAGKESDSGHPYGHERFECIAAVILAIILLISGIFMGYFALVSIFATEKEVLPAPGILALVAAVVSIGAKEAMYWYTRYHANQVDSGALMADAWHHRSDALSSVGALIGIFFARLGFSKMDAAASFVISLFVAKAAYDIFRDSFRKLVDSSCDEETEEAMLSLVRSREGVLQVDRFQTRVFGNKIYVDLEISVEGTLTLEEGHRISHDVHNAIEAAFPKVKHIMIHVNPYGEQEELPR